MRTSPRRTSILANLRSVPQSEDKPTTPSKLKRNSSGPPLPPTLHAQPRRQRAPVSNQHLVPPLPSFRTSTCRRTRSSSCGSCPTTPPRRVSPRSLAASKDFRKSGWFLAGRGSASSSTRTSRALSARRRLPRECPWGIRASRFASRSSGSSSRRIYAARRKRKLSGLCSFGVWRVLARLCICPYEETPSM